MDINDFDSMEQEMMRKHFDHEELYNDLEQFGLQYVLCSNGSNNKNNYTYLFSSIFCNRSIPLTFYGHNDYHETFEMERIVSVVVPILFTIIFIVGLFGNALVVMVVASNAQMRNTTNYLILNLAIADLLFIIFCVPFTATDYVLSYWPFGEKWCKIVQYTIIVTAYASVNTLVLMSLDRFLAVVYPVTSISIRTEKNTILAIGITWIIITVACSPAFIAHGLELHTYAYEDEQVCTFKLEYNQFIFQIIFMLTSYAIPLTIICLLYFAMLFRLWKSVSSSTAISNQSLAGKKRVTRMIVIVVLVFALCWLPIQIVLVLKSLNLYEMNDFTVTIQITAHVLGYMNSCVNPILYAFLSDNFRKGFRKAIQCEGNFGRARVNANGAGSVIRRRSTGFTTMEHHPNNNHDENEDEDEDNDRIIGNGQKALIEIQETTMLTMHCEHDGRNSHRLIQIGPNHRAGQEEAIL